MSGLPPLDLRRPLLAGAAAVAVFFGGFGAWALVAELERAAVASGTLVVESNRKTVSHLEGGIVGKLLVEEGATVEQGQTLVVLDDTLARANADLLRGQLIAARAMEARLVAERDGAGQITFPEDVLSRAGDPAVKDSIAGQVSIFEARRSAIESQTKILRQRVAQLREENDATAVEIKAQVRQLQLIAEEEASVQELVNRGLERKPRLLQLQRQQADIEGARAQNLGKIARNQQAIGETDLRILDLRAQMLTEAVQQLRETQTKMEDVRQRLAAAEDSLGRTLIKAPAAGKIVNLKLYTVGGTIGPREPLMEVVPQHEKLVVEAQVSPNDIDMVSTGLPAQVKILALNQRTTPTLMGTVTKVSADRLSDPRTGAAYYTARIELAAEQPMLTGTLALQPGMPAEAMIAAGKRTPFDYLVRPLVTSAGRALHED